MVDARVAINQYLLPACQALCRGGLVVPLNPQMYTHQSYEGVKACISTPSIGVFSSGSTGDVPPLNTYYNPTQVKIPPTSAQDDYYAFSQMGPLNWQWEKKISAPGSGTVVHYYGDGKPPGQPVYRKYTTESHSVVKAVAQPNQSSIIITGENNYTHWEGYFDNDKFTWNSTAGKDVVLWGR